MKALLILVVALLISACTTSLAQTEHPALLINSTPDSRAELLGIVRAALNNPPLILAESALTQDSVLLIERVSRVDANGLPLNGREVTMPERFMLSIQGTRCVLTHERTSQHWLLRQSQCREQGNE